MRRPLLMLSIVCVSLTGGFVQAQPDDEFQVGLVGRYVDGDDRTVERVDRELSFNWRQSSPDRRLDAGRFDATWRGFLMSQAVGEYQLHVYARGHVRVELGGRTVIDRDSDEASWTSSAPRTLQFDYHPLVVTFAKTSDEAELKLFWSGPRFGLEPVTARYLYHDPSDSPSSNYARGETLVRALRCSACHEIAGEPASLSAPALDRLSGYMHRQWLVDWLQGKPAEAATGTGRQMPHFALQADEASALADYLLGTTTPAEPKATKADVAAGQEVFLTTGCLACHQLGELGTSGLFGGGNLTRIAAKRPASFFEKWLSEPAQLNRDHRMPQFTLPRKERQNLVAYLAKQGTAPAEAPAASSAREKGRELFGRYRCVACHRGPDPSEIARTPLNEQSNWDDSCFQSPPANLRPQYSLSAEDQGAIREFINETSDSAGEPTGDRLLAESNCLACHPRDASPGLAASLPQLAEHHPKLAPLLPAMTPPSLLSVGDKLRDEALTAVIQGKSGVHRDYLRVQMPKFRLPDATIKQLVDHLIDRDRIPDGGPNTPVLGSDLRDTALSAAGQRLVTTDGFGCTSCHQVGSVQPTKAPLNARGPTVSQLAKRIRRRWFDRFVKNPSRIVPRMEMPSVQLAVRGIMHEDLDTQLAAVWDVLNTSGFEPPLPDPVRIVRRAGIRERDERAVVLTDVLRLEKQSYVKPLLVGLPNRHNLLFDLATGRLVRWSIGDTAHQRTEGKTWYWAATGNTLERVESDRAEISLQIGDKRIAPILAGQFITELDEIRHVEGGGVAFDYRLQFPDDVVLHVTQTFRPEWPAENGADSGVRRTVKVTGVPDGAKVALAVGLSRQHGIASGGIPPRKSSVALLTQRSEALLDGDTVTVAAVDSVATFEASYRTLLDVDQFPVVFPELPAPDITTLNVVPGFAATRLPLSGELMPTGMDWRPNGELVVSSLKGRAWVLRDTDDDELEDAFQPLGDELAAPYGVSASDDYVDVVTKYGVVRLIDADGDGHVERTTMVASGWGHTTDYHDWAVGLPSDENGNYYVALPCQQDKRSPAAAAYRGTVLQLTPRKPTRDNPRAFAVKQLTGGHRFPMGIARNRLGDMFVTDNQGNYNPFNELNYVVTGKRYGFINSLERRPDFKPTLTPPAIDIPHPWTRSVNGICFLETPDGLPDNIFGPFEGHLIGCEYDTRRLIRMSVHKVGETYQGAAYPFSYETPPDGPPLLGPLVCAVSLRGELYVGGIRDSGWGGANNIGELVRLRPRFDDLPCGIREVRATQRGFTIDFTSPIDASLARDAGNYSVQSVTRVSTPQYGGKDQNRRNEQIESVNVSGDLRQVTVTVGELREGYVYEFRLKPLVAAGEFFPAEAYYTLRRK